MARTTRVPTPIIPTPEFTAPTPAIMTGASFSREHRCLCAPGLWYYDRWEERINPPQVYSFLLSQASDVVKIWDPYVHLEDLDILRNIPDGVSLQWLSAYGWSNLGSSNHKLDKIIDKVKLVHSTWNFDIEIRFFNRHLDGGDDSLPFHDRYLVLDNKVYMVGASIEYHRRRMSSTAIAEVSDSLAKNLVLSRFEDCWGHRYSLPIVTYVGGVLTHAS
jgi:hypothetical protein